MDTQKLVEFDSASFGTRPMTTFDERDEGFEKKFAREEERRFKAQARRNRLLSLWAPFEIVGEGELK
jgi:hypothetical protein